MRRSSRIYGSVSYVLSVVLCWARLTFSYVFAFVCGTSCCILKTGYDISRMNNLSYVLLFNVWDTVVRFPSGRLNVASRAIGCYTRIYYLPDIFETRRIPDNHWSTLRRTVWNAVYTINQQLYVNLILVFANDSIRGLCYCQHWKIRKGSRPLFVLLVILRGPRLVSVLSQCYCCFTYCVAGYTP